MSLTAFGALLVTATLLSSGCHVGVSSTVPRRTVIRIALPESTFGTSDVGIEQLARDFSHEALNDVGLDGRAVPILSDGWTWDPGQLRLRIRLRPGVLTHDERPLTATMVADALRQAVATPSNRELYWSLNQISRIETTAENEIAISLNHAAATLPEGLDVPLTFGPRDVGTGPYRKVESAGKEIVLERFERYYRGQPPIERIVIQPFTTRTAWTSLLRGEIDLVMSVPPNALEFVSNDRIAVTPYPFPRVHQYVIGFNSARSPFRSAAVRRALNLAVDRSKLMARVLGGRGLASSGPLWPRHWAIDGFVKPYAFDPSAAESFLESAGFRRTSNGRASNRRSRLSFTCLLPANFTIEERLALQIQKDLYDVGVDVQFEALPPADYIKRILAGDFDAVLTEMISGPTLNHPFLFWRSARHFKGSFNTYGYENAEVERLFATLQETTNETVLRSAARRLQDVFLDDPPALFLAWSQRSSAVSRDFKIVQDPGRDPVLTPWQWTASQDSKTGSTP